MSVSDVMNTMMTQDATASMSADVTGGNQPAGDNGNGKPTISGTEDIFNLYANSNDDADDDNGVKFKEDKSSLSDEMNNTVAKELDGKKEEKSSEAETSADVIKESNAIPDLVKVKVNGVETEVPLKDVINSYSGQQEIQRRFTDFDKAKKSFETEKRDLVGMNDYVKQEIGDLRNSFTGLINQYEKNGYMDQNPLEAVNQLLDKMGINSNLFQKAVFEHQLPDYAKFFNMTETERDAHHTKQENDYLRKRDKSFIDRDQQVKLREENLHQDSELIKNAGLDSIKYSELENELVEAGHKDLTAQKIVEYAKQKPTLDKVVEVFKALGRDPVGDDKARTVYKILSEFPDTTVDEILDSMDPNRAALKTAKVLNQKTQKAVNVVPRRGEDQDLDDMLNFYKN
jgi:aryl carrier-like protein